MSRKVKLGKLSIMFFGSLVSRLCGFKRSNKISNMNVSSTHPNASTPFSIAAGVWVIMNSNKTGFISRTFSPISAIVTARSRPKVSSPVIKSTSVFMVNDDASVQTEKKIRQASARLCPAHSLYTITDCVVSIPMRDLRSAPVIHRRSFEIDYIKQCILAPCERQVTQSFVGCRRRLMPLYCSMRIFLLQRDNANPTSACVPLLGLSTIWAIIVLPWIKFSTRLDLRPSHLRQQGAHWLSPVSTGWAVLEAF